MYRPSNHFGQIGDDLFARPGRPFMGNIGHQGQQHFPSHQHPLSNQLQQVSGISPGLAPIGYGQPAPSKQLLNIMGNAPPTHYDSSNSGSPLNSPSSLGAIGTPVGGPFGPISPIGHSRRTSTPHGSTTSESIKPIQRPIGRPKDPATSMSSSGASSFDGLSLGLSGLAIGSELEKRSRSPPLNLSGSLDLDGVVLGTDLGRSTGSGSKSPTLRGQRESSLFSNSFFGAGGVRSSHDPFQAPSDYSAFMPQGHGSHQQRQQHMQQQLYMQAQFMSMDLHHQPLGLNSPPMNSSSSWGTNFVRPSMGLSSPPSRTLSPPLGLHNSSNNGSGSPRKNSQSFQVPMSHPNGLGPAVGSGRKSVSHASMHPSETTTASGLSVLGNGMRNHSGTNGQVMENDRLPTGYPTYGQQQQQHLHSHPLGAIGEGTHREGV
ncbi:hypothetical protein BG000_010590 [Podila horticola]|nr:hypothetical protein BG000_010590 [Podila horticola]